MINPTAPRFETRLARTTAQTRAGQALRYRVFVEEMGASGPLVDHAARRECDVFDAYADQMLLYDMSRARGDRVVGVYRLMDGAQARAAGQFYSEDEYDLAVLRATGRPLLELGRSCLHPDYRGGAALMHLWQGLASEVKARGAEVLFGVASFRGVDMAQLGAPLAALHSGHLAPAELRVRSKAYQPMDLVAEYDRVAAVKALPPLIKAYLRLGGFVGDGAFVDHAFNTTDVCLVLDVARMPARSRALYGSDA